jgi:hypothetical protein
LIEQQQGLATSWMSATTAWASAKARKPAIEHQQKHGRQQKNLSKSMEANKRTPAKAWTPAKEHQQKHRRQQNFGHHQKDASKSINASRKRQQNLGRQKKAWDTIERTPAKA